jgi:disulfide oxidoreductase YuzD
MKQIPSLIATALIMIMALASCVSAPTSDSTQAVTTPGLQAQTSQAAPMAGSAPAIEAQTPAEKPQPVLKQRTEEYRVPVVIKETKVFADGVVDQTTEYTWSGDYSLITSSIVRKPSLPEPTGKTIYEYKDGILAVRINYGPDGAVLNRSTFIHDAGGQLVRETMADGKGVIQSISEWSWTDGLKTEWKVLDAKGLVLAKTLYRYRDGLLTELLMSDGAGNSTGRGEYRYNSGGVLTGIQYYNAAGTPQDRIEYVIEADRPVQEKSFRSDGRLERSRLYGYGPEGQVITMTLADASGRHRESTSYDYAFRTETRTVSYYE